MARRWTLKPPEVPKVQDATSARSPFGRRAPIPSLVLIKRTTMFLEMVVCLLLFPCYFHQSRSNMIYSCVFTGTHSHVYVCVQRSEVDKQAFSITLHIIFFFLKLPHWTCSWPIQMSWLTGVPHRASCPCIPSGEIKGTQCNAYLFKYIDLRSFVLCDGYFTDWIQLCFLF